MRVGMKDINLEFFAMDSEHFTITKVENIVDNGYKIRCKEEEYYIIQVEKLLMKDNGKPTV